MLWYIQRFFFGQLKSLDKLPLKLSLREQVILLPLLFLTVLFGLNTTLLTTKLEPTVHQYIEQVHTPVKFVGLHPSKEHDK